MRAEINPEMCCKKPAKDFWTTGNILKKNTRGNEFKTMPDVLSVLKKGFLIANELQTDFFHVMVFPSRAAYHRGLEKYMGFKLKDAERSIRASCLGYELRIAQGKMKVLTNLRGALFFNAQDMGDDVVIHELAHAAMRVASKHNIQVQTPDWNHIADAGEEFYCCTLHELYNSFRENFRLYQAGEKGPETFNIFESPVKYKQ